MVLVKVHLRFGFTLYNMNVESFLLHRLTEIIGPHLFLKNFGGVFS